MFRTLIARYAGTCKRCKGPIAVGQTIRFGGKGMTYHLAAECPKGTGYTDDPPTSHLGNYDAPPQPEPPQPVMTPQLAADIRATFTSLLDRPARLSGPIELPDDGPDNGAPFVDDRDSGDREADPEPTGPNPFSAPIARPTAPDHKRTRKTYRRLVNPSAAIAAIADPF